MFMSWVLNTLYRAHGGLHFKNLKSHNFKFISNITGGFGGFNDFQYKERRYKCLKCNILFSYMREVTYLDASDEVVHSFTLYTIDGREILDKSCNQIVMDRACS